MSFWLSEGTMLRCVFGLAPAPLKILPTRRVVACNMPVATIVDNIPIVNITPFAMCVSPANPELIAAKIASLGAVESIPCLPVTVTPWIPGNPTVMAGSIPMINMDSMLMCMWAGIIKPIAPGQTVANA